MYNGPINMMSKKMKKFKSDMKTALWLAIVIAGLVAAILSNGVAGILTFVVAIVITGTCAYINNGVHDKLFNSDEHV